MLACYEIKKRAQFKLLITLKKQTFFYAFIYFISLLIFNLINLPSKTNKKKFR